MKESFLVCSSWCVRYKTGEKTRVFVVDGVKSREPTESKRFPKG